MTEQQDGGVEWELNQALTQIEQARARADFAAESQGWIRFSEGLRNASGSASAAQLIPMLKGLQRVRDERQADARHAEQVTMGMLDLLQHEQAQQGKQDVVIGLLDARMVAVERATATTLNLVAIAQVELLITTAQITALEQARDSELAARIAGMTARRESEQTARTQASEAAGDASTDR